MFIYPMLLQPLLEPFVSKRYLMEVKFNGFRGVYTKDSNGNESLYSRHKTTVTSSFPELISPSIPNGTVLDGEIVVLTEGKEDFSTVMKRFRMKDSLKIQEAVKIIPATYIVFDVMYWNGNSTLKLPLIERKKLLNSYMHLIETDYIKVIDYVMEDGISHFSLIEKEGREGQVARCLDASYLVGKRSTNGQIYKIINWQYVEEAYITGYLKKEFGIFCSKMNEWTGKLEPLGIVKFGMSPVQKKAFFGVVQGLIKGEDPKMVYLHPKLTCTLKGRGFTNNGYLQTPVFVKFNI